MNESENFASQFLSGRGKQIFEMEEIKNEPDQFVVEFNYCPLVEAWSRLTDDEGEISKLCDIAMDGDRGIISRFPDFQLEVEKKIADGDDVCRLNITRTCRGSPRVPPGEESASFRSSTQLRV